MKMTLEESELRDWAHCKDGKPFFVHPALDPRGFYKNIRALIRAVRADEREKCAKAAKEGK